jgi:hypothetical protein
MIGGGAVAPTAPVSLGLPIPKRMPQGITRTLSESHKSLLAPHGCQNDCAAIPNGLFSLVRPRGASGGILVVGGVGANNKAASTASSATA